MLDTCVPLRGTRRFGIGPRRALTIADGLNHGLTMLEPQLRILRTYVPATSYNTYEYLIRTAIQWAFDFPGDGAAWGLMRQFIGRATDVLTRCAMHGAPALEGGRSGADRYAFGERLPAALLACVTIDALADLCRHRVTVSDELTDYQHTWTPWDGPFLPSLIGWQTNGCLPRYEVAETHGSVQTAERVLLASRILSYSLWALLGQDLLRWVGDYLVAPTGPLTPLSRCLCAAETLPGQYIDTFLTACLTAQLRVNTLPGHVFVLPSGTFCTIPKLFEVLEHVAGETQDSLLPTLRQLGMVQPGVFALTIATETRQKRVTLRGLLMPHAMLQDRCRQLGPRYVSLPWSAESLRMYAAHTEIIDTTDLMEPVNARHC